MNKGVWHPNESYDSKKLMHTTILKIKYHNNDILNSNIAHESKGNNGEVEVEIY
jgi:hypothetical protein